MTPPIATRPTQAALRRAVALFVVLMTGAGLFAQSPTPSSVPELQQQLIHEQCRREAAAWELQEYQTVLPKQFRFDPPTAKELEQIATEHFSNSSPSAWALRRDATTIAKKWESVMAERATFQQTLDTSQKEYGFDWTNRTVAPLPIEALDYVLLAVGIVAVALGLWWASRRGRVNRRRRRRARTLQVAVAILSPLGLSVFFAGCQSPTVPMPSRPEPQREVLIAQLNEAKAQADQAAMQADEARRELLKEWDLQAIGTLSELRNLLTSALVTERLSRIITEEQSKLTADTSKLAELVRLSQDQRENRNLSRAGLGFVFAVVVVIPYLFTLRQERLRRQMAANTCPRCLATGKLKERRTKGDQRPTIIECSGCGYRCPTNTREMSRLCFPTVGIRSSGKTHLLVTAYASVKNRNTRTVATLQQAPSMGDEQFNAYIELVMKHRATAGATVHDMPAPIVLCVRDSDSQGANTVLVNLFDYSGEMMTQSIGVDDLRRRAVRMDGFLMLFDPTQMYGDEVDGEATLALEDQLKALHEFYQDMLDARGLPPGQVVPVPVAVCVSKFDLVSTRSPMGGQALPFLLTLKTDLDPPDELTLGVLRKRSQLVEQMLPFMLPGIHLQKTLREYFGDQFLFFPTSDRGLTAGVKGGAFGVVEPLLWLLHMHGYCVLKDD